jgi:ribonuclease R
MLGERTGRRFRLGDIVQVRVVRVDLDQRQIDFMLAEVLEAEAQEKKPKKKKGPKKSRS